MDTGKKAWQFLARMLVSVALTVVVTAVLFVLLHGMPIWGVPSPEEVELVRVEFLGAGKTTEVTGREDIGLAVKLLNHLNYQPFTPVSEDSEEVGPDVAVTYVLRDGRELTAGANWITGWWGGEAHALKEPDVFVNVAEGLFGQ